jgi:hypothetical protein
MNIIFICVRVCVRACVGVRERGHVHAHAYVLSC